MSLLQILEDKSLFMKLKLRAVSKSHAARVLANKRELYSEF